MDIPRLHPRAICIYLILPLLGACAVLDVQKPTVQVNSVKYQHASLTAGRLDTRLSVTNPNSFKLPIKALYYQLYLNEKEFVTGQTGKGLELAANETRQIDVPIEISYQKIIESLGAVVSSGRIQFRIKGDLDVGLLRIPYQKTGEFKLY